MRSKVILFLALLWAVACYASPLLQLAKSHTDPTRMTIQNGGVFLPHIYTRGGETGVTICWWVRWECPDHDWEGLDGETNPALTFQGMNSLIPAKPTTEGGQALPSFYENEKIPLGANASWGLADIIPDNPSLFPTGNPPRRYVVCCNIKTDANITLTIAGSEKFLNATNEMHIFNIECELGDRSIAISADKPDANISVAFAINPVIRFYEAMNYQCIYNQVYATNTFSFACLRAKLEGGKYKSTFHLFDLNGNADSVNEEYDVNITAFPKDCLFQLSQFTVYGRTDRCMDGTPRKVEIYGLKCIGDWLTDAQMWRIYDCDLAVIKAKGLTNALPYKR